MFAPVLFIIHLGALTCLAFTIFLLDFARERPAWCAFVTAPLCFITTFPFYMFSTKPTLTRATALALSSGETDHYCRHLFRWKLGAGHWLCVARLAFAIFLYRRGASFAAGLVPAIAGLWSAGVLAPATQEVSGGIDSRIFWYAALISVAALQMPVIDILRLGRDIIAFVMLLLAVKLCAAISACASFNRDIGELTQAVNIIPPSAPVFVALRPDL